MNLNELMTNNLINLDSNATTKYEVIRSVAKLLKNDNRINDINEFIKDVYKREEIESTNLLLGIAIPHSKSDSITKSSVSLLRIRNGVDWEDDKELVHIVFLLAVSPFDEGVSHLEVISTIATLLIEDEFVELLNSTSDVKEIINYINNELEGGNE